MASAKNKSLLREEARLRRASLSFAQRDFAPTIAKFASDLRIAKDAIVAGYWPLPDEADPRALMAALAARGNMLALPCVEKGRPLVFRRWREGDATILNDFKIDEPHVSARVVTPDAVLVPLLAFDAEGHRLGQGGGYYDRTLDILRAQGKVLAIGVAYAGQEMTELPREPHDRRLDMIVTEKGIRKFKS